MNFFMKRITDKMKRGKNNALNVKTYGLMLFSEKLNEKIRPNRKKQLDIPNEMLFLIDEILLK